MSVTNITELQNCHKSKRRNCMDFEFVRHEPLYDHVLLVLTLNRQKMKERILIGE